METKSIKIPVITCGSTPDLLEAMTASVSTGESIFETMADALAFCASIGCSLQTKVASGEIEFRGGDPVRYSIFENRGLSEVFDVIAVCHSGDSSLLAADNDSAATRGILFEEYAAGGLAFLAGELSGQTDWLDALIVIAQNVHGTFADRFTCE